MGRSIYILQASVDKGKTWLNLIKENSNTLLAFDNKRLAQESIEIVYESLTNRLTQLKATRIPKKYFRVKEYKEVE